MSKEDTAFPRVPNIRTIAITSPLLKLFEKIFLKKLNEDLLDKQVIHEKQRGFQAGKSTLTNIHELAEIFRREKQRQKDLRRQKVPLARRERTFVAFIDIRKAFDTTNNDLLLQKMAEYQINPQLVNVARNLLTDVTMKISGRTVRATKGTPQGAVTSPTLYLIYINSLVRALNTISEDITALAFADDIVIVARNRDNIETALIRAEDWMLANKTEINKQKSAVMVLRVDRCTPMYPENDIRGFPMVDHYKYLGITFDDDATFRANTNVAKTLAKGLKYTVGLQWAAGLPEWCRWQAWKALVESKFIYGVFLVARNSPATSDFLEKLYYNSLRALFRIKGKPSKHKLI